MMIPQHQCNNLTIFIQKLLFQLENVVPMKFPGSSFVMRKGLPYTSFFNYQINQLRGSGILQYIYKKHNLKTPSCDPEEKLHSISLQKVVFPFLIYIIGAILAVVIFIIEKITATEKKVELRPNMDDYKMAKALSERRDVGVQCNLLSGHWQI